MQAHDSKFAPGIFLDHAPLPMAMCEGASHIVRYVNPAFHRHFGELAEQLIGMPFHEMLPQEDHCMRLLDSVLRTGKPANHTEQENPDSHPRFWSYTLWPLMEDNHPAGVMILVTETARLHERTIQMNEALILGSVRQHELTENANSSNALLQLEISERTQAEQALHRAQLQLSDHAGQLEGLVAERTAELVATTQQMEAFVSSIAHDLRAPLRSMQGFSAALVEEAAERLSEQGRDFANRIDRSARFMDALLQGLLAFSRIARQPISLAPVNLEWVIRSTLARMEQEIQERRGYVKISGPWPAILAHESTLGQVVTHLLDNALKFSKPDALPDIHIHSEDQGPQVRVWVVDNGIGIAPDHQTQIFGIFRRLHGEQFAGTGIGLAIVQTGVHRMGGSVGVESSAGQGCRFWFQLRKAEAAISTTPPSPQFS